MGKKLIKYVTAFDCFDKTLIVLSATSEQICIISFTSFTGVTSGIASVVLALVFSLATGIIKNLLEITRNK